MHEVSVPVYMFEAKSCLMLRRMPYNMFIELMTGLVC